jgi:hypothetical protein
VENLFGILIIVSVCNDELDLIMVRQPVQIL